MQHSLNGVWYYRVDVRDEGENSSWMKENWLENDSSSFNVINLPNCWNSVAGLERFEGIIWFFKKIPKFSSEDLIKDIYIEFKAVNYHSKVWVNGIKIGENEGGFLPFRLKIHVNILGLDDNNYVIVRVENLRKQDRIPGRSFDWFNYGGIYRDVNLFFLEKTRIGWVGIQSRLNPSDSLLEIRYKLISLHSNQKYVLKWKLSYLGIKASKTNTKKKLINEGSLKTQKKKSKFDILVTSPKLWSPEAPYLYQFELKLEGSNDPYIVRFGIRTIKVKGSHILLNNVNIKLYGVNLHEEQVPYGRTIPTQLRREDILEIKSLNFNSLRTAHYPHDESLLDIADEEGILILEEIPVYWGLEFKNPKVFRQATRNLWQMIRRDYNHPSVIQWSVGNEIPLGNPSCRHFIEELIRLGKKIDDSRLFTFVMEPLSSILFPKTLRGVVDTHCLNIYFGWYYFSANFLHYFMDILQGGNDLKPWLITEFGAGAKFGYKDSKKFSEKYQAAVISQKIRIAASKEYIAGWFIWVYRDFRSHMRTNIYQNGYNRKGIVDERNRKKLITHLLPRLITSQQNVQQRKSHLSNRLIRLIRLFTFPLFKLVEVVFGSLLSPLSDVGDKYYTNKIEE
ncbi:MAG: hypothetical protein JSV04_10250 [Candidatus Heimdallarchaeota archaeon]|nr:MAG: hypothetical protein JSV04_10250 [Candidatus Heimdallarchaeota archaeon]